MKKRYFLSALLVILLILGGCSSSGQEDNSTSENQEEPSESDVGSFPVTIDINGKEITIDKEPNTILPLSLETAEILLELVDPSKIPAVTKGIDDPYLSTHTDIGDAIPNRIGAAVHIDPEEIIGYDTDLLLLTKMYGQEEETEKILSQLDTPVLSFDPIVTVDGFMETLQMIGEAVGEKTKAEDVVSNMEETIASIQEVIPEDEDPTVLVLSEVGGDMEPFMMGPTNISYDLIHIAGATPAVDAIDLERSTPAAIEQILKMDPDYIFLLDFYGEGEESFDELMKDPGWNTLQAVKDERIKLVDAKYMLNPNVEIVEGLKIMTDWIYNMGDE